MSKKNVLEQLRRTIDGIEKQFGKGAIMCLGDDKTPQSVEVIPTGCMGVDLALGVGGFPRGRIVEVFGPEASGKTTLALHAIAQAHKQGLVSAFIDAEHALDVTYAQNLGVQPDRLLISQPDSGEQALEICETLVRSGAVDLIVIDSVAALVPRAEIEGEMGDSHMGLQARLMSQAMRKLAGVAHRTGCTLIFINQLRQKIGVVFGNPEVTTGGNALKFYASVRVEVRRGPTIKSNEGAIGNRAKIKIVKNKLAPPFKQVEVDVLYGQGIWAAGDLLDRALDDEIVSKSGAWFYWGDKKLGQGRNAAGQALEQDEKLFEALKAAVICKQTEVPKSPPKQAVEPLKQAA